MSEPREENSGSEKPPGDGASGPERASGPEADAVRSSGTPVDPVVPVTSDAIPEAVEALRASIEVGYPEIGEPAKKDAAEVEDPDEYIWPPPPKHDRWKHRRGEPRLFAFLWMVWLICACVLSLAPLGPLGLLASDATRPACRRLVLFLMVGIAILWPLVRLSQAMPRSPRRAVLQDLVVMLVPAQAIFWPLFLLTSWAWSDMATVALVMVGWAVFVAGVLSLAMRRIAAAEAVAAEGVPAAAGRGQSSARHGLRAAWSVVFLALAGAAPVAGVALGTWTSGRVDEPVWAMASPLTAGFSALEDRRLAGPRSSAANVGWAVPAVVGGVGLVLMAWGGPRGRGGRMRPGLH